MSAALHSQTTGSAAENKGRVFQANKRIVILDVVVSSKNGRPVEGLQQEDFRVSEDGRPQIITSLEEHTGAHSLDANLPELPAGVYTNIPRTMPADSLTVIVLDSLNTPLDEQTNVRLQVLKYLKRPTPGRRTAIFTLGTKFRLVQGFTDDPSPLLAALNNKKDGVAVQVSPLLQSSMETAAARETIAALVQHSPDAASNMQQYMAEEGSNRGNMRLKRTLDALQALAQYLAGLPGRKNVAWFSGAFPIVLLPSLGLPDRFGAERDDQEEVRKTDALLASAQIAIYPIAAEGVVPDPVYDADADPRAISRQELSRPQGLFQLRSANKASMDEIASETGGIAIYGTNSMADALDRVASHGSHFYTLTYTSNRAPDGTFRKIQVALTKHSYQLAYRSGYYADDFKAAAAPAAVPAADPLSRFLQPGWPNSTQVPFTVRVVSAPAPDKAAAALAIGQQPAGIPGQGGDNPNLSGALTRYSVDFMIPARGLEFETAQGGRRRVNLEVALVVYGGRDEPLNWMLRQVNLNLDSTQYAAAQNTGVNLFLQIDAPGQATVLRPGVYDLNAGLAGTLEVPLSPLTNSASGIPRR